MAARLNLGGVAVNVVFKNIKNIHLSVYPPNGRVRISAPARMKLDTIRVFAISNLGWIKRNRGNCGGNNEKPGANIWIMKATTFGGSATCCASWSSMRHQRWN
jgi:predicted metal-dependent hydrolase